MPDKLRDAAHARRRRGRSPLGGWARSRRARETIRKSPYFCEVFLARGADCAQRAEDLRKSRAFAKAL